MDQIAIYSSFFKLSWKWICVWTMLQCNLKIFERHSRFLARVSEFRLLLFFFFWSFWANRVQVLGVFFFCLLIRLLTDLWLISPHVWLWWTLVMLLYMLTSLYLLTERWTQIQHPRQSTIYYQQSHRNGAHYILAFMKRTTM